MKLFLIAASLLLASPQDATKAKVQEAAANPNAAIIAEQLPSYPLQVCVVSGKELGSMGDPIDKVVDGTLVRLCCGGCEKKVDADPAAMVAKVQEAVVRVQKAGYPLEVCPVSGEPLEADAVDHVVGTRLVRTCCKRCAAKVTAEPAEFMAKVNAAYMDAQRPTYPLKTCVISGEELGDDAVEMLYGTRLVRLCCKKCVAAFPKDAKAHLAKLDAAAKAAGADKSGH